MLNISVSHDPEWLSPDVQKSIDVMNIGRVLPGMFLFYRMMTIDVNDPTKPFIALVLSIKKQETCTKSCDRYVSASFIEMMVLIDETTVSSVQRSLYTRVAALKT